MFIKSLVLVGVVAPVICAVVLGVMLWRPRQQLREELFTRIVFASFALSIICYLIALIALPFATVHMGSQVTWFDLPHYHYSLAIAPDAMSLIVAIFSAILVSMIGAFSRRYLHRDPGYFRFYLFLSLFGAGVEIIILSSSLDFLFIGWEIVGFTSAMLIAFFYERPKPVEHGLRAFLTYRICDVGLLSALVILHHSEHGTLFVNNQTTTWLALSNTDASSLVIVAGFLLVWAAMGKSAQVPLSGWLPRAMEGPTPSSAIFYGAISIHLGAFLLLRLAPLIASDWRMQISVLLIGLLTALHGSLSGRVQSDIKSVLAYASITQVGVIWMEIALGFYTLAVIHMIGHAALRSLQILRSPSLLHDHQYLESAMGATIPRAARHIENCLPYSLRPWVYRHGLERGVLDAVLRFWFLAPVLAWARWFDRMDQRWARWLNRETN
ncbi:proton-conducting transporter membrane subunit [Microbulbifer variabilis]|uniref:proton-conducting transporter transmembrane domain-containing protein n=1 Tax=Microbulbifer variabilis TaxID=266805 RepID=UPI001CFCFF40|nr:proton-conducting transporter membrane subunit [Microbulbifer variabilis]